MKEQDEQYFGEKMLQLAAKFNEMAEIVDKNPAADPESDPALTTLRDDFAKLTDDVGAEFDKAGYTADDWNNLFERSGAMAKMGMC